MLQGVLFDAVLAGVLASLACGLGVAPLAIRRLDPARRRGVGYGLAGGLMFAASVYNLILPGLRRHDDGWRLLDLLPIVGGLILGAVFLTVTERYLHAYETRSSTAQPQRWKAWGGRVGVLVFLAMTVHSIPEGVAVGVGYTSDAVPQTAAVDLVKTERLGPTLALAVAIHNIPEGLAVAIPLRSAGMSLWRCFWAAVFTSLPQPIAAIPAVLLAWFFAPLMPVLMGFAAGAMIFLVVLELIPEALEVESPRRIAWAFLLGFCGMMLVQVVL